METTKNPVGTNGQKTWTLEEDAKLFDLYRKGAKSKNYADLFPGRTKGAVRVRCTRLARDVFTGARKDPRVELRERNEEGKESNV